MKKFLCLMLVLVLCLSGCASRQDRMKEPVTFYYLRNRSVSETYDEFFSEGAIGFESREASGHRQDLNYLLSIYLQGPLDSELTSPFPAGCRIMDIQQESGELTLLLNGTITGKNDMDLTIACACLAMTCLDLTDADTVHIESHSLDGKVQFIRSFTENNLFLTDEYTLPVEATEETQ